MVNIPLGKSAESPIAFKAGAVIFAQGESSRYLYIVKKGEIRLLKVNGKQLSVLGLCREKEILNEVSVLTSKPVEFSAIAKTDVELVFIEQKDILSIIKSGPSWIPEILETLCDRLKSTMDIIEEHKLLAGENNPDIFISKEDEQKCLTILTEYRPT